MRVRPFFWLCLALACVGVLSVALLRPAIIPAKLQAQISEESLVANHAALIHLHLTDTQGLPINQAQITPSAQMPDMQMEPVSSRVAPLGSGQYAIHMYLTMAGTWEITFQTQADGFSPLTYVLHVKVEKDTQTSSISTLYPPPQQVRT
jgi:hypothetical protein